MGTLASYLLDFALDYAMRQAIGNENNLGFTLDRSRSRRHPAKVICETDFADDIVLLSNALEEAQLQLSWVERSAKQTGLHINNAKTEYVKFNLGIEGLEVFNFESLKKCLTISSIWDRGLIVARSKDANVRLGKAWSALHKLDTF